MSTEKVLLTNLIDKYANLQRLKVADDIYVELDYQIAVTMTKLSYMGVNVKNITLDK